MPFSIYFAQVKYNTLLMGKILNINMINTKLKYQLRAVVKDIQNQNTLVQIKEVSNRKKSIKRVLDSLISRI